MRYSASEKLEIIRLVEQSHLPVRRTLGQIGIPRSTHGQLPWREFRLVEGQGDDPRTDILSLVRSVSDRRPRGAGRSQSSA
jgi:hypothetical protein